MDTRTDTWNMCSVIVTALLLLICSSSSSSRATAKPDASDVRILFLTDCTPYSDWMSIALVYSYLYSGHKGPITRVMCCSDKDRQRYNPDLLTLVETHIAPSVRVSKRTGDNYAAYDKPGAVIDYINNVTPPEDWLLVLDSDMIVRRPVRTEDYNVSLGWAVGSRYNYMIGVNNKLADRHIPEIPRRNDTFAGPAGRRSDMVGGFFLIHKADLKRMSKLWLQYAEDVRADPEAYKYAGDSYAVKPGDKPWISEMYGYSYGAAKANVWHHWDETTMLYPGYNPLGNPKVLHFGLQWQVQGYTFDKHWYTRFNARKCAPWNLATSPWASEGLFPHPPRPRDLTSTTFGDRYRDLIALEGVATLNAGLCWWHRKRCPANDQMERECTKAEQIFFEVREALKLAEEVLDCVDTQPGCPTWAAAGECTKNSGYMAHSCRPACKLCVPKPGATGILERLSNPKGVRMVAQDIPNLPVIPPEFQGRLTPAQGVGDGVLSMGGKATLPAHGSVATVTEGPTEPHGQVQPTLGHADDSTQQGEPTHRGQGEPTHRGQGEQVHHPDGGAAHRPQEGRPQEGRPEQPTAERPEHPGSDGGLPRHPVTVHRHHDDSEGLSPVEAALPSQQLRKLLRRCHRMGGMTMDEVKACVQAAKHGEEWARLGGLDTDPLHPAQTHDQPAGDKEDAVIAPVKATPIKKATPTTTPTSSPTTRVSSRYVPSQLGSSLLPASLYQLGLVLVFFVALLICTIPRRAARRRRAQQQRAADTLPESLKSS